MPQYKLEYFATTGIGELIRFLLSYADQDFEDVRYDLSSWPKIKPGTPYGVLPVLEIDGKSYHQSLAIGRYLAKEYNLAGKNNLEDLELDALADTINDFRILFTRCLWEDDPAKMIKSKELLMKEQMPFYLNKFQDQVNKNGGYFYGGRVTWVDLFFTSVMPYLDFTIDSDTLKDYPDLKELTKKVEAIPGIKKWIEKRPTLCCLREHFETA